MNWSLSVCLIIIFNCILNVGSSGRDFWNSSCMRLTTISSFKFIYEVWLKDLLSSVVIFMFS